MRVPCRCVGGALFWGVLGLSVLAAARTALAQEEKKAEAAAPAATAETPPAPEATEPVPPYFTGENPDDPDKPGQKKELWPDPTGLNAGYWATPSKGPIGDGDPAKRTTADLYDRIVHNLFSINMVWA